MTVAPTPGERAGPDERGEREPRARGRVAAAMAIAFAGALLLSIAAPRRHISGDTVPGRLGAALLRCGGSFDLRGVDWIAERAAADQLPYWARRAGDRVLSVFGPGPAIAGAVAMPALGDGQIVDDDLLRRRERFAAAVLLGMAAALLALATAARRGLAASAGAGLLAAASFAGAATLGQGLWQQTVALPLLTAALAALAWRRHLPRAGLVVPALLVLAVLIRPTIAPLVAGLGIAWRAHAGPARRIALALGLAALAAVPLLAWNLVELGAVLPLGQLEANQRVSSHVFILTPGQIGYGLGGLLLSPARGWLWFAPIAVIGAIRAARTGDRTQRWIAVAIAAQVAVIGVFHMWWGGICFGPRFLAEATWIAIWLALDLPAAQRRAGRALAALAIVVTVGIGQLGLWGWRAEQWETRRNPDLDHNALWDPIDSPILAIATADIADQLLARDSLDEPARMQCRAGSLRRLDGSSGPPGAGR